MFLLLLSILLLLIGIGVSLVRWRRDQSHLFWLLLAGAMLLLAMDHGVRLREGWRGTFTTGQQAAAFLSLSVSWFLVASLFMFRDRIDRALGARSLIDEDMDRDVSRQLLEHVVELSSDGFWTYDPRTHQTWVSSQWCHLLGYTEAEVYADGERFMDTEFWRDHLHPDDLPTVLKHLEDHIAGKTDEYHAVYRIRAKSGDWRWRDDRGRVSERDARGNPTLVVGVNADITEEVRQKEAVEKEYRETQQILGAIPAMVFYKDTNNVLLRVNRKVAEEMGRPVEEFVGRHAREFWPSEADGFYEDDLKVIRSRTPKLGYQESFTDGDGTQRAIQTDKIPLIDERTGEVTRVLVVTWDITNLKRAEAAVVESRSRFQRTVAGTNDGLWEWNLTEGTAWYAPRFAELFEFSPEELPATRETLWRCVAGTDREEVRRTIESHIRSEKPIDLNFPGRTSGGGLRWYRLRAAIKGKDSTGPRWLSGSVQDITTQRIFEQELERRTTELQSVFEAYPDVFFRLRADGVVLDYRASEAGSQDSIYRDLPGSRITQVLEPAVSRQFIDALDRVFRTESRQTIEYRLTDRGTTNGSVKGRWYEARLMPFQTEEAVVIVREITTRVESERALLESLEEIQQRNEELDQFAYVASHDLRSPLRGIDNLTEWLQDDAYHLLPEESQRHFDLLKSRVRRMEGLLDGLLNYSRAGRKSGPVARIDCDTVLNELADLLSTREGIDIVIDRPQPVFETSRVPLEQVFLNLIGNAVKHHDRQRGEIRVTLTDETETHFEWTVTDDGPGIDPRYHEKIFGMFQTLRPRDELEASGMGLAVVQKLLHAHDGEIFVESEGRGTRFRFTWPKILVREPVPAGM